ncbi:energy transducer TonB [Hymenobacter lucidus]|uniref:Energy transducer TonB n=1 Tax=Hymenobacter lucidus TaxID=2880930 RepID=A0ABS8AK66_9BACT|nr:energy transducer TonB [Hymenobacter lucidus]MCB2406598.1 energy transducer TonB [Hymenobacter lucidus]
MLNLPILNVRLTACYAPGQPMVPAQQVHPRLWHLFVVVIMGILALNSQQARAQTNEAVLARAAWTTAEDLNPTSLTVNQEALLAPMGALPPGKIICYFGEKMPEFPGGYEAMLTYFRRNLRYSAGNTSSGKVFVSFTVTKTGAIRNARVMKGITPALDVEAVRVVSHMPSWKPGEQNNQPIDVDYTVPVTFSQK